DVVLQLYVAGAHLSPRFGSTVKAIEADGWLITARVETTGASDAAVDVAAGIGAGVAGFARAFERGRPDLIVLLGDRLEMLAAALEMVDGDVIVTYPGVDAAHDAVIGPLESLAATRPGTRMVPALGEDGYGALLREADVMVGNSSSGLIEAPSFGLPVVNVGI